MKKWLIIGSICFVFFAQATVRFYLSSPPERIVYQQTGDVLDLIRRLKPVTKERYRYTLGSDVVVCFESDVSVSLKLNMKNDNEYTSKAPTLQGAVEGITRPSDGIRNAISGWGQ